MAGDGRTGRLAGMVALTMLVIVLAPFCGAKLISPLCLADGGADARIFWMLRVPRVLLAFLAGAFLSLGGMVFQSLFRNSLATPYTLGLSGGAALGVAVYVKAGAVLTLFGHGMAGIAAFIGAVVATLLVFGLCGLRRRHTTGEMLLAGVAVSILCSNAIMLIQYMGNESRLFQTMRWMMGGVAVTGYVPICALLLFGILPVVVILLHSSELDLLMFGGEFAASKGVDAARCRTMLFASVSLMVAAVVSICGPIGFIGMICPHICRLIYGSRHKALAPMSLLLGGAFLVFCDAIGRCVAAPTEIPVGIITAMVGCPFFLWLLYNK